MARNKYTRRDFLSTGTVLGLGALLPGNASAGAATSKHAGSTTSTQATAKNGNGAHGTSGYININSFSRYEPSFGGPPGSDHYLGKLVPGLRGSGLPPVTVHAPDLKKIPWKMVGGVKEFHITCQNVKQELLPGTFMNIWGYNGSAPGPMIEAYQGDRCRFIVHNELPEPTSMHWHGLELPIAMDGVPGLVQDLIQPGQTYVYEFDLHQTGTFFYHAHVAMQEAMGMAGLFIIHPKIAYDPPVDRDFALVYQNYFIPPNSDIVDTSLMDWNWHAINGRCGPSTTPMVVRLGERVRVRLMNFSPMQHHPIHFHGHTFG